VRAGAEAGVVARAVDGQCVVAGPLAVPVANMRQKTAVTSGTI